MRIQATVFGAACAENADRKRRSQGSSNDIVLWEDADLDSLGLSRFGVELQGFEINTTVTPKRIYRAWMEDWEVQLLNNLNGMEDNEAEEELLRKYGNIKFTDAEEMFVIDSEELVMYDNCYIVKEKKNIQSC